MPPGHSHRRCGGPARAAPLRGPFDRGIPLGASTPPNPIPLRINQGFVQRAAAELRSTSDHLAPPGLLPGAVAAERRLFFLTHPPAHRPPLPSTPRAEKSHRSLLTRPTPTHMP